MGSDPAKKNKSTSDFWRALRFTLPYWRLILISVLCALFCGTASTLGLGAIKPICNILFNGDTIQSWAQREIVSYRLKAELADDAQSLLVLQVRGSGPAATAGLGKRDVISMPGDVAGSPAASLATLSDPDTRVVSVQVNHAKSVQLNLPPMPGYLAGARVIAGKFPANPVKAISWVLGLLVCLAVVASTADFVQEHLSDIVAIRAVNDIRRRVYDHILHVPLGHFNLSGTSDVTSRLVNDAQGLQEGYATIMGQTVQQPIKAAMALGCAFFLNWRLTLVVIGFAPLMLAVVKKLGKKMRRASKKALLNSASMLGQIDASLQGIRVVKGATAERFERRRYTRIMSELMRQQVRMSRIDSITSPALELVTLLVVCGVVLVASYMVTVSGTLTKDNFITIMGCLATAGDSLRRISKVNNTIQKASAAAGRIFEVLSLPSERGRLTMSLASPAVNGELATGKNSVSARRLVKLPPLSREVKFENVTFSYPNATSPALRNISLTVPKGKCIAVVGGNGSGKTTLLALLPRFYEPREGRILIDGMDIRDVSLRSLRRQISIVTQDSVIFPGTIAQNIAYGQPQAKQEDIESAARRAFAHDFILQKPTGYDTSLGGLGSQLSGGQKQRLCIARAIFHQAPILILDEATSQIDAENEQLIQKAIDGLLHERTMFVIAHRFSTIKSADEIVVMDAGQIVGQGQHEDLLRNCDVYQRLYEGQLIGTA